MVKLTTIKTNIALIVVLVSTLFAIPAMAQQGFQLPQEVVDRSADIYSEGTRLTAHIFTPKAASPNEKLPAIIMAQGWGGTQSSLFWNAAQFARAGYYAVTFDFRGWGESDSRVILTSPMAASDDLKFRAEVRAVREVMDPMDMGMDWLNVLHWIQGEDQVDVDKIGVWGSSMAAGFAIYAAANDSRVKAIHSQVTGTVDGRGTGTAEQALQESTARARGELDYPEPRERWNGLQGYPIYARFTGYNPAEQLKLNDTVALQIVLAEKEEYGTNPGAMEVYANHDGPKNLVVIPDIKHYDIYTVARQQAQDLALSWFDKHLK